MKNKDITIFSIDALVTKKWTSIAVTIISALTMIMLYYIAVMYFCNTFFIDRIDRTIKVNKEGLAKVTVASVMLYDETYIVRVADFLDELKNEEGIDFSGGYFFRATTFEELFDNSEYKNINENYSEDINLTNYPGLSIMLVTDFELFPVCGLTYDKEAFKEAVDKGNIPILVGNAYKDLVNKGDTLISRDETFEVIGTLKSDEKWLSDSGISFNQYNVRELDYCFAVPREYLNQNSSSFLHTIFWYTDNPSEFSEIEARVRNLALEYDIVLNSRSVKNIFNEYYMSSEDTFVTMARTFASILLIALLSSVSSNIVSILFRKAEIGIYLANGVSVKDLCKIIFVENCIKTTIAVISGFFIGKKLFGDLPVTVPVDMTVVNAKIMMVLVALGVVIVFISTFFPIMYILKKKPAEFLEEYV